MMEYSNDGISSAGEPESGQHQFLDDGGLDPKSFKTLLCANYLKGPCKRNPCPFAHGTSELRIYGGDDASKSAASSIIEKNNLKTSMCVNFVSNGSCPNGTQCRFEHSVKKLNAVLNFHSKSKAASSTNPNFKTTLCANFITNGVCSHGDECQYAHGRHELREKVLIPLSEEVIEKKKHEKISKMPGYKTKLCSKFESNGSCDYGKFCHFAHGKDELKDESELRHLSNPMYKSSMCKNPPSCTYGETCLFAHTEEELRTAKITKPCKTLQLTGHCNLGSGQSQGYSCNHDHSHSSPIMCKEFFSLGHCPRGALCFFIHGQANASSLPGPVMKPVQPVMCKSILETGRCQRIFQGCNFAHSENEIARILSNESKYKTTLCQSWNQTGKCDYFGLCRFAHGVNELRVPSTYQSARGLLGPFNSSLSTLQPSFNQPMQQQQQRVLPIRMSHPQQLANSKHKVMLCNYFAKFGRCEKGEACRFAHGFNDLRRSSTYKTALCKQMAEQGFCPRGECCSFAHSTRELRPMSSPDLGKAMMMPGFKRKQDFPAIQLAHQKNLNYKSVLCQKFKAFGSCPYGDACTFAHGDAELSQNKRIKI